MILPQTAAENQYVCGLAALWRRARAQDQAGDLAGSKALMAAHRDLIAIGATQYKERHAGLLEYAGVLAREEPISPRLATFLAAQDERLADVAPEPEPEPEVIVPVTTRRRKRSK